MLAEEPPCLSMALADDPLHLGIDRLGGGFAERPRPA
jgi:hypothetical protein